MNNDTCDHYYSGHTLLELLVVLTLISILLMLGLPLLSGLLAKIRLNIATFELSQYWKFARFDAMGSGATPNSLCMKDSTERRHDLPGQLGRHKGRTRWFLGSVGTVSAERRRDNRQTLFIFVPRRWFLGYPRGQQMPEMKMKKM